MLYKIVVLIWNSLFFLPVLDNASLCLYSYGLVYRKCSSDSSGLLRFDSKPGKGNNNDH